MNWNCTQTEERLIEYFDGSLDPLEAAQFSAHATGCGNCAQLIARVGGLVARMHQLPPVPEPTGLVRKILDTTLGARTAERAASRWLSWLRPIWEPRFAMGIVTVAASLMIVLHAATGKTGRGELNPVNLFHAANRQVHLTYARSTKFVNDLRVVYEIQSRLTSPPDSMSEPAPRNETQPNDPQPKDPPPSSDPREKSQTAPHQGRRESHGNLELAVLLAGGNSRPENLSDFLWRRQS